MVVRRSSFWAAVLLMASLDLWCSSSSPPCPASCVCRGALLLNCSSAGLSSVPQPILDPIAELDLSHNLLSSVAFHQPHPNLRNLWLGNNSIPHLSLCIERTVAARRLGLRSADGNGSRCPTWAPALQLLSAERNLLERLPRGLDAVGSLQVLELSFNRISSLEPGVLGDLHQLRELHLQHNLITHLDPQMFQNLKQIKVLDLRFNMLTTMQQLTYLTLRDIGADVKLGGNRWHCDCNMRSIRRQMAYDSTRGMQTWNIICSEPSTISGKDLLQLDDEDLTCSSSENNLNLHRDVTVHSGAEILLSCSAQESEWWTPNGRASVSQQEDRLLIRDFSEGDTGLYVCVSEEDQVLSVFNLQISKMSGARQERSLPAVPSQTTPTSGTVGETAGGFTQSDMALAVCLSILFTFLLAFILGVLARPCIDRLWRRVSKKKESPATHTVTSAQQRHYDNQAFSNAEEPEEIGPHRERRVTFSRLEFTEESNVQYYDTVASGDQQSIRSDEVFEYQEVEIDLHRQPNGKQSDDSSSAELAAERLRNMKFEHIPDPDESKEKRSLSSSSDSSQSSSESDRATRKHTKPKSLQVAEDSFQTRADLSVATNTETPQISKKGKSGSSALHTNKTNTTDSDISQDDEELFEFSDDAQSPLAKNGYDTKSPGDAPEYSSSASSDSSDNDREPMQTKIKQKEKKKQKKVAQKSKPGTSSSSSSHSESEEDITYGKGRLNIQQLPLLESKTKMDDSDEHWPAVDCQHIPRLKRRLNIKVLLPSSDSSSSSESGDESRGHVTKNTQEELMIARRPTNESQKVSPKPGNQLPGFELRKTSANKRPLDTKIPTPGSDSSTSSDSDDETTRITVKKPGRLDVAHLPFQKSFPKSNNPEDSTSSSSSDTEDQEKGNMLKQRKETLSKIQTKVSPTLSPKPGTDSNSSSSSDSDHGMKDHITQQEDLPISKFPIKVTQIVTQKAPSQWPSIDLGRVTRIKRRLDIKAPKAHSDSSSSSDSEDEARDQLMKQNQEGLLMSRLPSKAPPTVHPKPENRWPASELGKTTQIKKSVDIKASSTDSDSSSSSDSDNERKDHMTSKKQMELHISKPPTNVTTGSQKPEGQWPVLDFGRITRIKRRLDIKAPKADTDSSSSSDSEYETRGHMMQPKQEELPMSNLPSKVSPKVQPKAENRWSAPDLGKTKEFKNRLNTSAQSTDTDSSSSSDSDNERKVQITENKQKELYISKIPVNVTTSTLKPSNQWPSLDFGRMKRIKRRLDIKAPTADSESSSSSDSEDETRDHVMKPKQDELVISQFPGKVPPTVHPKPENRWSVPDLGKTTQIKKPVDIKASSTDSDSSSSNDSGDDMKHHITQKKQEKIHIPKLPVNVTTSTQKPANQWPTLDFFRSTKVKRRLDIKAPTADSESSSSSDGEDETRGHVMKQKQQELLMSKLPSKVYPSVHPKPENRWPANDLGKTTQIKKPVDIKASSTDSESSSSSDSDNERNDQITQKKQEELYISKLSTNVTTSTQKPASHWPSLDFGRMTRIKRRLDIKAPIADKGSSSSSGTEDETRGLVMKQKQEELLMSKLPSKVFPAVHPKPENRWSAPDLGKTTQIKKNLKIKPTSTDSDSSCSSNSDNERKDQKKQKELYMSRRPTNETTGTPNPANQWPTLDFGRVKQIKRRLDIKAPTADSDLSSSSDSDNETRGHVMKQKQEELVISQGSVKVPPTVHPKPENRWSVPDLGKTTQIKKPVDIKASSTDSDSSSSNDSGDDMKHHITQKKQEKIHIPKLPVNVTTSTQKPANQWPILDFFRSTKIKRRLDIKAPTADSESSSSSDGEDETRGHVKKQEELLISQLPVKVPPLVHPKPEHRWSAHDLGKTKEVKNPLDTRVQSTDSDSSSSSNSDNERQNNMTKLKQEDLLISKQPVQTSQKASQKQGNQWPSLDLWKIRQFKRRLDIKAPAANSKFSSSSDSEDETSGHVIQQKQEELRMSKSSTKMSAKVKLENHWPSSELGKTDIKSPLDIKVPSPSSDSSSSSEDETRVHMKTQNQEEALILRNPADIIQSLRSNSENQWPTLDLGQIPSIQRRLDIKTAIPHESLLKVDRERNLEGVNPSLTRQVDDKASSPLLQLGLSSKSLQSVSQSSSSESEDEKRDQKARIRKDQSFTSAASEKFRRLQIAPGINIPYNPKTDYNIKLEKYTSGDLEDMPTNDTSRTPLEVDPELQSRWATMNLGVSRFRKHLEISSHATESDLNSPPDSPFSIGSESGSGRRQRLRRRFVEIQETTHKSSSPGLENVPLNVSPIPKSPGDKFTFSDIVKQRINKNHSDKHSTSPSKQSSNSSSSSDREDETKDHSFTDLSRSIPHIKRHFDIKAPSPEPSNTPPFLIQNEDLTEHNAVQSTQASTIIGPTDESLITYKRSIFKSLSLPSSSLTPISRRQTADSIPNLSKDVSNDKGTSLASKATKSTSLDNIIKRRLRQSRSKTDGDLMEKIQWTRVGQNLPDLSSSKSGEGVDVTSKSLPQASFTELTSPSNNSASSTPAVSILQLSKKSDATRTHNYSSLGPEVTPSPSGDVLRVLENSYQRTPEIQRVALGGKSERKGLSALKAMSRERKNWEWDEDAFDSQDGSISNHSQSEKDKVSSQQSQIHSPSASESKKDMDLLLLYGVPRYKRHSFGDSLTGASLPDPATPRQDN